MVNRQVSLPAPDARPGLTATGRILLGMIAEGHRTGYAIKSEIERSTRFFWGASFGGIYPTLKRLVRDGLVDREDDPRGGARRHAYRLTAAGRAALGEWLADPVEGPVELRDEGLLKMRFAEVLEPESRLDLIRRMRQRHDEQVRALRRLLGGGGFDDDFDRLTIEYLLGANEWARNWCDETLVRLAP